jgi:hypothetical protein
VVAPRGGRIIRKGQAKTFPVDKLGTGASGLLTTTSLLPYPSI